LSTAAAELQNSSGNFTDCFRVFHQEAFYRRRGIIRRRPGGHTIGGRGQGLGRAPCCVGSPWPPSGSRSVFGPLLGKIRVL
jgi:hypothetical protein